MNEITLNNRLILVENLTINFDKNEICIVENDVYSESYSFFAQMLFNFTMDKLVYLKDKDGKKFSFYDCYVGKSNMKNNEITIRIIFQAYITDYFMSNIKTYEINKMEVKLEYKKFDMGNIEESLDKNISFNIGKMNYKIELIFYERFYKVILMNDSKLTT